MCVQVAAAVSCGDACFGTIDSWIIYCLTGGANGGVHVTDGETYTHRGRGEMGGRAPGYTAIVLLRCPVTGKLSLLCWLSLA